MKMNLAKAPNSDESHWEYLDIFLFSNGHHSSPPRKYHLKYEELDRWDKTLRKIAQTQYDEKLSSVDLYTTKGDKVTSPIEIVNNNAYVAVPPQEKFIPAAYNEYLLKATRSWEKRQGNIQKSNTTPVNQTVNNLQKDPESKADNSNTVAKSTVENGQLSQLNESKTLSQTDNKPSLPISRKIISNITRKTSMKTAIKNKEIPQPKKNLKVNMEETINKEPGSKTNHNIPLKSKGKEINKFRKTNSLSKYNTRKIDNKSQMSNENQYSSTITDENNVTIDYPVIENLIDDEELIIVKHPDSIISDAKRGSLLSKPIIRLSDIPILPILEENKTNLGEITSDVTKPIVALPNIPLIPILEENKANKEETAMDVTNDILLNTTENNYKPSDIVCNIQYDTTNKEDQKNNINQYNSTSINLEQFDPNKNSINRSRSKENLISVIDRGELIDFSLKIELKKCDGTIKTQYNTDNKRHIIGEKESCLEDVYKQPLENKSDTVTKGENENEEKLSKMIVVQCPCCNHEDFNEILQKIDMPLDHNDKMYVVLIPYLDYKKPTLRCYCDQDSNKRSENEAGTVGLNTINPAMTVDAGTSSIIVTEKDDTQNDTTLETQINDVSASRKKSVLSNNDENLKSNIEDDDEVVIRKEENINLESSPPNYVEFNKAGPSEKIESLIVRTNASYMTNQCIDKSTQTEWSSVLLEAKRHEDGHYSFHLPPLSVLKYYFW